MDGKSLITLNIVAHGQYSTSNGKLPDLLLIYRPLLALPHSVTPFTHTGDCIIGRKDLLVMPHELAMTMATYNLVKHNALNKLGNHIDRKVNKLP